MRKITNEWFGKQIQSISEGNLNAISAIYGAVGKVMFAVERIYLNDNS